MGELKIRYQHGSGGDVEGFKARLGFLATDLADVPPDLLRPAVATWVRESPFLPTAADLIRIMREALEARDKAATRPSPPPGYDPAQAFGDQRNAIMASKAEGRRDIEWFVDTAGEPKLRSKHVAPPSIERVAPHDVDRLNRALRKFSAPFRYDRAGYDFDLPTGVVDPTDAATEKRHP